MLQLDDASQQVLIVGDGSLFHEGVTRLLNREASLQVSHVLYAPPARAFLAKIKWEWPVVILGIESETLDANSVLGLVSSRRVHQYPLLLRARIVFVRLSNNLIDVYARPVFVGGKLVYRPQKLVAKTSADLVDIVSGKRIGQRKPGTQIQ
jgi:hypothetical protein